MRTKPLFTLAIIASVLVGWLSLRMWCGHVSAVWHVSCALGAWAPLFGAAVFLYVASVSDRANNVAAAWLVRAIGMHSVLLWMVGMADLIHGPPDEPGRDPELFAPLLLLSFAPVFFASVGTLRWGQRVVRELGQRSAWWRPSLPPDHAHGVPFRGVRLVLEENRGLRAPHAAWLVGLVSIAAAWASGAWFVPVACALALAPLTVRNPRAFTASLVLLPCVACAALFAFAERAGLPGFNVLLWMPVAGVGVSLVHLGAVELMLGTRLVAQTT